MPVFTASGPTPVKIVSNCARSTFSSSGKTACAQLLCGSIVAINVTAVIPYTPYSSNVFKSASKPAPPEASEPAIVAALIIAYLP